MSGPECPEPDIHILDCGDEALACQAFEGCIANPTPECYQHAGWLTDCTLATSCE